ncbi:MAG: response regulator [Calothrix sp. SM1_5_4]|nr:response regulator [Calothrix sp. SM1_5_4]
MSDRPAQETIVIAEDSPPNRKILAHLLEKLGFNVVACENGHEAWTKLSGGELNNVILVISDIMMPNMDGIELLRNIRGSEQYKNMPVILVTAVSEKEYIVQAKEMNVNGYILKARHFSAGNRKIAGTFSAKNFPKLAG